MDQYITWNDSSFCDKLHGRAQYLSLKFISFSSIDVKREQLGALLLIYQGFKVEEGGAITDIFSRDLFKYLNNFKATGLLVLRAE